MGLLPGQVRVQGFLLEQQRTADAVVDVLEMEEGHARILAGGAILALPASERAMVNYPLAPELQVARWFNVETPLTLSALRGKVAPLVI